MNNLIASVPVAIGSTFGSPFGQTKSLADLVSVFVSASLVIAGVMVLFLFIFGGLKIIMSAGQDDPRGAADGKQAVTMAVTGFIVVFTAYWVIKFIELAVGKTFIVVGTL